MIELLNNILEYICSKPKDFEARNKQKIIVQLAQELLQNIEVNNSNKEIIDIINTMISLHTRRSELSGNLLVSELKIDDNSMLKPFVTECSNKILNSTEYNNFIDFMDTKIKSTKVKNKVDEILTNLVKLQSSLSDSDIVKEFTNIISAEYIELIRTEKNISEISINPSSIESMLHSIQTLKNKAQNKNVIPSGIKLLDTIMLNNKGFESGRVYIVAGKPGLGKSTFTLNFAVNAAKFEKKEFQKFKKPPAVVYISLENDEVETYQRILRILTDKNIDLRNLNQDAQSEILTIMQVVLKQELKIKYMVPYKTSTTDILIYLDKLSQFYTITGIYIDYLDLMVSSQRLQEKRHDLGYVTSELKVISQKIDCAVITPSQVNTSGYKGIPTMANVDESRQKVQNADFVSLLFPIPNDFLTPSLQMNYPPEEYQLIGLNVDKNRDGSTGILTTIFKKSVFRIIDIPERDSNIIIKNYLANLTMNKSYREYNSEN